MAIFFGKRKKISGKTGLAAVVLAVLLVAGFGPAIAQYGIFKDGGKDGVAARALKDLVRVTGHASGSGFEKGGRLQLVLLMSDGSSLEKWADISDQGRYDIGDIDLTGRDTSVLTAHFGYYREKLAPPVEASITFNRKAQMVSALGAHAGKNADIGLFFEDNAPAASTVADWAGNFSFDSMRNPAMAEGNGKSCLRVSSKDGSVPVRTFCLVQKIEKLDSSVTLVALNTGGGTEPMSIYSIWHRPANCQPVDVTISVCDPAHMTNVFTKEILNFVRAFMTMTEQFTAVMMEQARDFGMFLDAKQQLEIQQWFQLKQAEAHKDYIPSKQMCVFGTFSKGLNTAERKMDYNAGIISHYMIEREIGPAFRAANGKLQGTGNPEGQAQDRRTRIEQFRTTYCDPNDNNEDGLTFVCRGANPPERRDRDINYTRTVEENLTLDADFSNTDVTGEETDILALSKYLFSHDIIKRPDRETIFDAAHGGYLVGMNVLQDARDIIALRSPIRNSFGHLVAMRTEGTGLSGAFMRTMLRDVGIPDDEIEAMIGENPSYFAQMEVLTKKMYQNPNFYTNLYDKPANVERMGAVLQAIQLMHDRDRFEASLRREMLVSILLETHLREAQNEIDALIQNKVRKAGVR